MKLETRLMIQFLTGVCFLALFLLGSLILIYSLAYTLKEEERESVTPEKWMKQVVSATRISEENVDLDSRIKQKLSKKDEWLQILDEGGRSVFRYHTPKSVPPAFSPSALVLYKQKAEKTGYDIHTWYQTVDGNKYTWILGRKNPFSLLQQIKKETQSKEGSLYLPPYLLSKVKARGDWIQILDAEGSEIYQYAKPENAKKRYTPGEFARASQQGSFYFLTDRLEGGQVTWVYHVVEDRSEEKGIQSINRFFFFCTVVLAIGIFILFAYHFGKRLGEPLLFMLKWLRNLSSGVYRMPSHPSHSKSPHYRKLKKSFALYQEVIQALERLSNRLKEVDEKRKRLDQSREEWLAGVTHDLKTPLSTIKGYADLYRNPDYRLNTQEIEGYLQLVAQKTEYMQQLIDDMSLTFQIKNHALPLKITACDMKELIRLTTAEAISEFRVENPQVQLSLPADTTVMYPIDAKWFKRALMNLLVNAWIHNPPETKIVIQLEVEPSPVPQDYSALKIVIKDYGQGMDEKTLASLFDQYDRGTNTNRSTEGTGLGMAIAKHLIEWHQGKISVKSKLHYGTTVTIRLPAQND